MQGGSEEEGHAFDMQDHSKSGTHEEVELQEQNDSLDGDEEQELQEHGAIVVITILCNVSSLVDSIRERVSGMLRYLN